MVRSVLFQLFSSVHLNLLVYLLFHALFVAKEKRLGLAGVEDKLAGLFVDQVWQFVLFALSFKSLCCYRDFDVWQLGYDRHLECF